MDEAEFIIGKSDFHNQTTVHPLGLTLVILLGLGMCLLPRQRALITMLACASLIAVGQRVVIFSLDFHFLRLMVVFGWLRILARQEFRGFRWQALDFWVVAWTLVTLMVYPLRHRDITYKVGITFDSLGTYFLVRMLVRDIAGYRKLIESLALISVPVACFFFIEHQTHRNLFAMFGGVPEVTMIREGKLRCQGAYAHPILAGCFWAILTPWFMGRIVAAGTGRYLAIIGTIASLTIVVFCSSSTPIVGVMAAIAGFCVLPLRRSMAVVRWAIVIMLTCLHMVMEKPVWHLIARTDLIGGSTGWHRYQVIDQFITHFTEWALFGSASIDHWNIHQNDITNEYVAVGLNGGAISLFLFLGMISVAFANVGRLWRKQPNTRDLILAWSIGVSLFVHIINFFGVSYFGQIDALWYISLALTTVGVSPTPSRAKHYATSEEVNAPLAPV